MRNSPPPEFQKIPEFQTDSQFDLAKYQRWLTSSVAQQYLPSLEAQYRDRSSAPSSCASSPPTSTSPTRPLGAVPGRARAGEDRSDRHRRPQHRAGFGGHLSDAEINAYYKAHLDDFDRPATSYLSFVALPRLTTAADTAAARARVDSARAEIAGGAPFADVARRESADSASAAHGGDLGEWTKGAMNAAFDSAASKLPLNTLSGPVLSQFVAGTSSR